MSNPLSINNIHISIDSDDESQSDSEHDEVDYHQSVGIPHVGPHGLDWIYPCLSASELFFW